MSLPDITYTAIQYRHSISLYIYAKGNYFPMYITQIFTINLNKKIPTK